MADDFARGDALFDPLVRGDALNGLVADGARGDLDAHFELPDELLALAGLDGPRAAADG